MESAAGTIMVPGVHEVIMIVPVVVVLVVPAVQLNIVMR